jgi:hypothetical protein
MDRKLTTLAVATLALAACGSQRSGPPPPTLSFEGLPVSGSLADAHRAGFTDCKANDAISMRCRRHGVIVRGAGPYEAAVDLAGSDGGGGFDEVTLWHPSDQYAVYKIADVLEAQGWKTCSTGTETRGDQIATRMPARRSACRWT